MKSIEIRVGEECIRRSIKRVGLERSIGKKWMLKKIEKMRKKGLRKIKRVMSEEIDEEEIGEDKEKKMLKKVDKRIRWIIEKKMGLIEEEKNIRIIGVEKLRKLIEKIRNKKEKESGIKERINNKIVGGKKNKKEEKISSCENEVGNEKGWLEEEFGKEMMIE